jgi:hypothetical protein
MQAWKKLLRVLKRVAPDYAAKDNWQGCKKALNKKN